jgi:hypothetical protein
VLLKKDKASKSDVLKKLLSEINSSTKKNYWKPPLNMVKVVMVNT